jgi:hypothetical protein
MVSGWGIVSKTSQPITMSSPAKAGEGNPHKFVITESSGGAKAFENDRHYVGLDAVIWFVNQQGGFFTDRMVAGTVEIALNGSAFPVVLGQYELKGGQQIASIFDRALISSSPYKSGRIVLKTTIQGNKSNTMAGALLKQVAAATLTAVAGAVTLETGGLGGVALSTAGGVLVKGVQQALDDNSDRKVTIFDSFEVTIDPPSELRGSQSYLLIHRGSDNLDASKLKIVSGAQGTDVNYDGSPFRDGAWLLIRLRRLEDYHGDPRPWSSAYDNIQLEFVDLFNQWATQQKTVDEVKQQLRPTTTGNPTLADELVALSRRISADEALIIRDRKKYSAVLYSYLNAANKAAAANDPGEFTKIEGGITQTVRSNAPQSAELTGSLVRMFSTGDDADCGFSEADAKRLSFKDSIVWPLNE